MAWGDGQTQRRRRADFQQAMAAVTRSSRRAPIPAPTKSALQLVLTEDERAMLAALLKRAG